MAEGCGVKCMKYLLFIFNFIIALLGLGEIAIGCVYFGLANWFPIQDVTAVLPNAPLSIAVYLIIGAGALTFIVAICGCLGVIKENKYLLAMYFFLMLIIAAQITAGYLVAIYDGGVNEYRLEEEAKDFLQHGYDQDSTGVNKTITASWDTIQNTFECCGVDGKEDYATNAGGIPASCCAVQADATEVTAEECGTTVKPYTKGCSNELEDLPQQYSLIIVATALVAVGFEVFSMFIAGWIWCVYKNC